MHSQAFKDFQLNSGFLQPETPMSCGAMCIQPAQTVKVIKCCKFTYQHEEN